MDITPEENQTARAARLREHRQALRAITTAERTVEELLALPDSAAITPFEAASLLRVSVETLILIRQRRQKPSGFKIGKGLRYLMGEIRAVQGEQPEAA